jgi:hypothetical protein
MTKKLRTTIYNHNYSELGLSRIHSELGASELNRIAKPIKS